MSGINLVTLSGNLGADPELRMAAGDLAVLKLRLATNEVWFDKEQKKQERTEWHRVTVFGKRAEGLAKFLKKGMFLSIVGSLRTSSYDKDGQKHFSTEIIAEQVALAPKGSSRETDSSAAIAPFAPFDAVPPSPYGGGRSPNNSGRPAGQATLASVDIPF